MAEATEDITEREPEPILEPDPALKPEGEPGGDKPEDVFARKEYRTRKRIEGELAAEREARIRLEEQLRAANQREEKTTEKPDFTVEQVQAEVDAGRLSPVLGAAYIARTETKKTLAEERRVEAARKPVETAIERINEYRAELDWAVDRTHPNFLKAQQKFRELVSRGSPANEATELTALEFIAGDLDTVRKRNAMREATRRGAEPVAPDVGGGNGGGPTAPKVDLNKAPTSMRNYWDQTKLSQKSREREYGIYLDLQKRKRA